MKKILILAAAFCLSTAVFAQAPQKMSYQAVVRNASNSLVAGSPVGMRISVLQGSPTGTAVFVETHNPNSNANGLVSLEIGGGTTVSGSFSSIDWANGPYFIQTETDPTGGTNYTITGTSQFLSVPYALYAETSGTPGPQGPAGATGAQGAAGQSAYQVWLAAGNTGTEADFLATLLGAVGPQGATGADGATGPQGIQGIPGNDGATGAQGVQGPIGPVGPQGPQGIQGVTGNSGSSAYQVWLAAGNTGTETDFLTSLIGAQGTTGNTGAPGTPGAMGMQGPQGIQGPVGPTGPQGIQGLTGNTGSSAYQVWLAAGNTGAEADFLTSLIGAQGATGNTGAQGIQGPIGPMGPQGTQGIQGAVGAQGPAGNNGSSAYQIWLENGHTGTESDFLLALVGAQGTQGIQGPVGPIGPQGNQGAVGPQGSTGPQGVQGIQGAVGPQGPAGNDGATGPQGPVGTFQTGTARGQMLFWDGNNWIAVAPPATNNQTLLYCYGSPTWGTGTCPALTIGANAYGGIVAYILQPGDPGYNASVPHGLIVAPSDLSVNTIPWGPMSLATGATGQAIGDGPTNTVNAANVIGSGYYAPILCNDLVLNGYSDWYLPSRNEMQKIWDNRALLNAGFNTGQYAYYVTSTEYPSAPDSWVYVFDFGGGAPGTVPKIAAYYAHAVRSF